MRVYAARMTKRNQASLKRARRKTRGQCRIL